MARTRFYSAVRLPVALLVCAVGRRAAFHRSRCARHGPQSRAMRRGFARGAQAGAMSPLRTRMYPRAAGWSIDGFVRRFLRGPLQLWAPQTYYDFERCRSPLNVDSRVSNVEQRRLSRKNCTMKTTWPPQLAR